MALLLTVLIVFALLLISELWWRNRAADDELSRKFVHITVGSFVAFWPFFLSWRQIELLSLAFLVVVVLSKRIGIFNGIHSVQRRTWGEVFFALAVGVTALATHHKAVYAVAILQMSLADGLAAVMGVRYGRSNRYKIFGFPKSVIGTATFLVVSMVLLLAYVHDTGTPLESFRLLAIAALAGLIENAGVYGLDNLLVPVVVAAVLGVAG